MGVTENEAKGKVMNLIYKFWLAGDDKVFGEGPCELLERVGRTGSLKSAAREMGMSYSKAWTVIRRAEKQLGFQLLLGKAGGSDGGGSLLTPGAEELILRYRRFSAEAAELLPELYKKHFADILG
jgi:molybdate transport system regulatory protein